MNPALALLVSSLLLAGCVVGPDYRTPSAPDADPRFDGADAAAITVRPADVAWWEILDIPQLDDLIQRAAAHNHDLRIARANVRAARAFLKEQQLDRYPAVTADGGITRQKTSSGSGSTFDARTTLYAAGFDVLWELDFFGRVSRSIEALAADYQALVAAQRATFVTVAAEVARSYIELRGAQFRLDVAIRNAENQQQTLELTQVLSDGGRGTELEVLQAQAQLESTRASIPPLRIEIKRAAQRLSVLVGETPGALEAALATPKNLPALPEQIAVGSAQALLRRRPDIAAAERALAADTARIGIEVADLFPRINLVGSAGFLTINSGEFGERASQRWSIGPQITWAALDLGTVRARIRAAEANADASLAFYEQSVLLALEETENAMQRYVQGRLREQRLEVASQASSRAAEFARLRFSNGVENFLTVLDAERRQLEAQDALASARAESVLGLIAVYKALGGGWQAEFVRAQEPDFE